MTEDFSPRKIASVLIILAIAVIFALQWGPGSRGCEAPVVSKSTNAAAMVNGKEIPLQDFARAYANQIQYYRSQGSPITSDLARQLGLHKQILDQLVNNELWAQAAEHQGITASDAELRELIRKDPTFQKDGKFDPVSYQNWLSYMKKSPGEFEGELRRQLAAFKMQQVVDNTAAVSDDEVKARFLKDGNKAMVTYVRFLPTMFVDKAPAPTPEQVAQYKKDHAKELADYYEANRFQYQQPEKVHARHILIKVDKDAPADQKDEAKRKIEALRKQIEGGKDFAAVAKEASEDLGSKVNGGDLGFNDRSTWVPEFANAAFSLKPGEVSQPVETKFGYHLIKVEEKKAPEKKELKDVEDQIAQQLLKRDKAGELARAAAEKALAEAKSGKKLTALYPPPKEGQPAAMRFETETKPEAVETGEFSSSGGQLPRLGPAPKLTADIFAAQEPRLLDQVYPVGEGFVVAEVAVRKLPTDKEFAGSKDKLRWEALQAKKVELRESYVKDLKKSGTVTLNEEAISQVADRG